MNTTEQPLVCEKKRKEKKKRKKKNNKDTFQKLKKIDLLAA